MYLCLFYLICMDKNTTNLACKTATKIKIESFQKLYYEKFGFAIQIIDVVDKAIDSLIKEMNF